MSCLGTHTGRFFCRKEKPILLIYKEAKLDIGYRLDLLVESKIVVEIKVADAFSDVHLAQISTYLKLSNCKVGLLLNFKSCFIKKWS